MLPLCILNTNEGLTLELAYSHAYSTTHQIYYATFFINSKLALLGLKQFP